jgi:mRNA-degrading endonuclease YafQ of YafQ-DinJ toxin-antitoxin module
MWRGWPSEMPYTLVFTESYVRRASRWLKRHPDLRPIYLKTLQLLEANPHHPSLRLHALSGKSAGLHSVSINLSYRITLEFLIENDLIVLVNVGDHDSVYR